MITLAGGAAARHPLAAADLSARSIPTGIIMRILSPVRLTPLLVIAACAPAAGPSPSALDAAYARTPGETLHYREVSESSARIGMGVTNPHEKPSRTRRDARFAIHFTGGDSARAWFQSLRVEPAEGPALVAGADVLEQPFALRVGPLGIDSVPGIPPLPSGWSGLESQFRNLFPRLPGGPLARGREWSDGSTTSLSDSLYTGHQTRTLHYRVVGDSVIGRERVVVAEYELRIRGERRGRDPGRYEPGLPPIPQYAESNYQEEQGRIYIAPRTGRFVRRTRSGTREHNRTSYTAAEGFVQATEYTGTIELLSAQPGQATAGSAAPP